MSDDLFPRVLALWEKPIAERPDPELDFAELYADPTIVNGSPMPVRDLVARARALQQAFPERRTEILQTIDAGDQLGVAFVLRARHDGTLTSALGPVPATGRDVEIRTIDLLTVENGKITKIWVNADDLGLLRQLGVAHLA